MSNFTDIAQQFVKFYYDTFDTNRSALAGLYRPQSMLTFETSAVMGAPAIIEKLTTIPLQQVKHEVTTLDPQPTAAEGGIIVMVTGRLLVDEEQKPMAYVQTFHLAQDQGQWFVLNDIFRLVYSASQ